MKKYKTNDGEELVVENDHELIRKLRALSHDPEPSEQLFMEKLAERAKQQTGMTVPTGTDGLFITGLLYAGLLIEVVGEK